jgi:pyrroline-5-carboxylate reductase
MEESMKSLGFIGAGRIVRIFIEALHRQKKLPDKIVVNDPNVDVIKKLQSDYPEAPIVAAGAQDAAAQDIVFLAVHPPQIGEVCKEMAGFVKTSSIVVSLAPVVKSEKLAALLGTQRLVRMIPNAASFMNTGYNPVWFSKYIGETEKNLLSELFAALGNCPEVDEEKLEAYAIVTAMGPTYLWPQLDELHKLALEFGLTDEEARDGMKAMVKNTIELLYDSGLDYNAVEDLIPVKPLGESEQTFREIYKTKLTGLYNKLNGK